MGTSHGPRHPEMVSWITRFSFSDFQAALIRSTGTSGSPRSVLPQQQPLQRSSCPVDLITWSGSRGFSISSAVAPCQNSIPCWALTPDLYGCLIGTISETRSAASMIDGGAPRPVRDATCCLGSRAL